MSEIPPETYAGLIPSPPASCLDTDSDYDDKCSVSSGDDDGRRSLLRSILDINLFVEDAAKAIVNDTFSRCFQSQPVQSWDWNPYLFVFSFLGYWVRQFLFVVKLLILAATFFLYLFPVFGVVTASFHGWWKFKALVWGQPPSPKGLANLKKIQSNLINHVCCGILFSWFAAIRYHGIRPVPAKNHIWVANHTSMIDYAVVCAATPFAAIMQYHPGWMGWIQEHIMGCIDCVFFNRGKKEEAKDALMKMKAHMEKDDARPLLVFPEGTCVNNEYCVMFKSGAFKLGATVCPIAIKYNKLFVDPFWNSRKEGFMTHLFNVMGAWTVPADVYFMEPQNIMPGETHEEFANRVRLMIAERAGLKVVDWDGMLKYKNPSMRDPHRLRYNEKAEAYPKGIKRALGKHRSPADLVIEMKEKELHLQREKQMQGKKAMLACDVGEQKASPKGIPTVSIHAEATDSIHVEATDNAPSTPPSQGGCTAGIHWSRKHED